MPFEVDPGVSTDTMVPIPDKPASDVFTHDDMDGVDAPTTVVASGGVQYLTVKGRLIALAGQRDTAIQEAATKLLNQPDPDALIRAKTLLSESFKWLDGFQQTADLRQRIILFMEGK